MLGEPKQTLLLTALAEVPFTGFSDATLKAASEKTGIAIAEVRKHFPKGGESLVEVFSLWCDAQMQQSLAASADARIRDRITQAVRSRIEIMTPYREAARRAAAFLALPQHAVLAARLVFSTVDTMWRATGDKTSDFNYYTKRGLLAGVYGSTLLHWLTDSSEDYADTWRFLDARIDDVMGIQKFRSEAERRFADIPNPLDVLAGLRRPRGS